MNQMFHKVCEFINKSTLSFITLLTFSVFVNCAQSQKLLNNCTLKKNLLLIGNLFKCEEKDKSALFALLAVASSGNNSGSESGSDSTNPGTSTVDQPTFSPVAGMQTSISNITIQTTTPDAKIYYTIDGSDPTTSSTEYTEPLKNNRSLAGKTIKAIAVKSGMTNSSILSGVFQILPLKTGQTQCYNASGTIIACFGSGQDGEYKIGMARSYTDNNDGTVTDNSTGLIWQKCSIGQSQDPFCTGSMVAYDFDHANHYCSAWYLASKTWRLPTVQELRSLIDYKMDRPSIDPIFLNSGDNYYNSSTQYFGMTNYAWRINFAYSTENYEAKSINKYVRCVFGPKIEYNGSFNDNGNGTITDNSTGLIWQKCSRGQNNDSTCSGSATTANWNLAISYCSNLTLASKTWRLPNINELKSILNTNVYMPSIDPAFPNTLQSQYWSSTSFNFYLAQAWYANFIYGAVDGSNKTNTHYVRCVSGP